MSFIKPVSVREPSGRRPAAVVPRRADDTEDHRDMTRIHESLSAVGIDFEGRALPVSLQPTALDASDVDAVIGDLSSVRAALVRLIERFLSEVRGGASGGLARFFAPYQRWFDLIAGESRRTTPINLMRYDTATDAQRGWQILETNTCCPGGVIHCARIRDAWQTTATARCFLEGKKILSYPIDDPMGFVRFLAEMARRLGDPGANIAICSYKGMYKNEVESLRRAYAELAGRGEIDGRIILCDLREIECDGGAASVGGERISIVYNKIDQLAVDPRDPAVQGWVRASRSEQVEFVNSLSAMFLTEAKRALACLSDPRWQEELSLDAATRASIERAVPWTRVVELPARIGASAPSLIDELLAHKDDYVLKADSLTRGAGVFIGETLNREQWLDAILVTLQHHGVAQRRVSIPTRRRSVGGERPADIEYFGVDFFFFGSAFAGAVSRCHSQMIFNVGNGGWESPTVIVEDRH